MEVLTPGVKFKLNNFNSTNGQIISFTQKTEDGKYNDGTTNEEVINMLIERFYHLQSRNFSLENQLIIVLLKDVRRHMAKRLSKKIDHVKSLHEKAGDTD
jgi:hypothetical protein